MLCSRIANGTYGTSYVINCFDFKFKKEYQSQKMLEAFSLLVSRTCCTYPHPRDPLHAFARTFQLPEISRCFRATDASGTLLLSETAVLVALRNTWALSRLSLDPQKLGMDGDRASEGIRKLKPPAISSLLWACFLKTENRKASRSSFSAKYSAPLHNCVV